MSRSSILNWLLGAVVATGPTACSIGPDYERPAVDVPTALVAAHGVGVTEDPVDLARWWTRLGDDVLVELVDRVAESNLGFREALARIDEARARRGVARADWLPSFDADAGYRRQQVSRETVLGGFGPRAYESFSTGFDAAWEIDVWGRVRRAVEAEDAVFAATVEDARDVLVTVIAETALAYVDLRSFEARLEIARSNERIQGETLGLTRALIDAGLASELDVARARANLERTRAAIPPLEVGVRQAKNRLAILLGEPPGALDATLDGDAPIPAPTEAVAIGVPADVLRRRADVRRSERELAALTARIGVAEADLYPYLTLNGTIGLESTSFSSLATGMATSYGFGPSIRWTIFDGGRIRRNIDIAGSQAEQALLRYESTVLSALEEVENSVTAFVREEARRGSLEEALEQSRRAVELSEQQYRDGLVDFQSVLDSERELFAVEDAVALNRAEIATRMIALYKALGGGWEDLLDDEGETTAQDAADASAASAEPAT